MHASNNSMCVPFVELAHNVPYLLAKVLVVAIRIQQRANAFNSVLEKLDKLLA